MFLNAIHASDVRVQTSQFFITKVQFRKGLSATNTLRDASDAAPAFLPPPSATPVIEVRKVEEENFSSTIGSNSSEYT